MGRALIGRASDGRQMHYSVGAVIKKEGKYLLIDRATPPFGFACVAGHIDIGETAEQAADREVQEESGLVVIAKKLLFEEEIPWNTCSKGIEVHYWKVFECDVTGRIRKNERETKSIGRYNLEDLKRLPLEPVWEYWMGKMGVI